MPISMAVTSTPKRARELFLPLYSNHSVNAITNAMSTTYRIIPELKLQPNAFTVKRSKRAATFIEPWMMPNIITAITTKEVSSATSAPRTFDCGYLR